MLVSCLANASSGGLGSISISAVQSNTDTGINAESRFIIMPLSVAVNFSNVNTENIASVYGGFVLPVWIPNNDDYMLGYLNLGIGTKGVTNKFGLMLRLTRTLDMPIGVTFSREFYKDNPEFDNTQFGITYYFE